MNNYSSESKQRNLRSQSLDLLRFPLAIVIVLIHVIASRSYQSGSKTVNISTFDGADIFFGIFDAFFRGQSVPIYFFIAGYVFFLGINLTMDKYGRKLKNRYHSLFIPYIIWNIVALGVAFSMFLPAMKDVFHPTTMYTINFSVTGILECFWNSWYGVLHRITDFPAGGWIYPQDYPLWFVRDLMLIVLAAPALNLMLRHSGWAGVALLGVTWIALSPFQIGHWGQILTGAFFFSWGAWMSYHGKDMIREFRKYFKLSAIGYVALGFGYMWAAKSYPDLCPLIKAANSFAGMFLAYSIASYGLEKGWFRQHKFLASSSFFVYAGHAVMVAYINQWIFRLVKPTDIFMAAGCYALTLVITVGVLLGLFRLLCYCPTLQRALAGRKYEIKHRG